MSNLLVKSSGLIRDLTHSKEQNIETVMLLHGWGMNSLVWEPVRAALESQYHIIWVDLPGHGFNRHIEAFTLDDWVELVAEVTPKNTHIIAWSLGGMVAQALSQKIPNRLKSLTMVTSTPRFSQTEKGDWPHAMSDEVLNRFANNLKQDTEKTLKGFIALQFIGVDNAKHAQDNLIQHMLGNGKNGKKWGGVFLNDSIDQNQAVNSQADSNQASNNQPSNIPTQEALDAGLKILKKADLRSQLPTCPEHWIFGEYDRLIPKEVINDLISLRPDAEITLLKKTGHAPFITHPESFLNKLNTFINAQT